MSDVLSDPNTLPLQVFTTAASLLELVDKKVVLTMRDGRVLYAVLRSFDAYGNLVLQNTIERIFFDGKYAEKSHGVWIIRGENIALVGELDLTKDDYHEQLLASLEKIDFSEAEEAMDQFKGQCDTTYDQNKQALLQKGLAPTRLGGSNPYLY